MRGIRASQRRLPPVAEVPGRHFWGNGNVSPGDALQAGDSRRSQDKQEVLQPQANQPGLSRQNVVDDESRQNVVDDIAINVGETVVASLKTVR